MDAEKTCKILSIEAWRCTNGGWDWNNWHNVGAVPVAWCDLPPRKLFAELRRADYLAVGSIGRVAVENDGYNVVIVARGTREPIFAIEYGSVQP